MISILVYFQSLLQYLTGLRRWNIRLLTFIFDPYRADLHYPLLAQWASQWWWWWWETQVGATLAG